MKLRPFALFTFLLAILGLAGCAAPAARPEENLPPPVLAAEAAFPRADSRDLPPDVPLKLRFAEPVAVGAAGRIEVRRVGDDAVVAAVEVTAPTAVQTIGGLPDLHYQPLLIDGRDVTVRLPNGVLAYGATYEVRIDAGAFRAADGPALIDAVSWRFSTRAQGPAEQARLLVVAADGSGDFCTVQGAFDFIPVGNRAPRSVYLKRGVYAETLVLMDKHNVTLVGEARSGSVIAGPNNERLNPNGGRHPYEVANPDPSEATVENGRPIYRRGLFLAHRTEGLVIENLTIRNTTPKGGSQAEALILNGSARARTIVRNVDLFSYQDTLQTNGTAYFADCTIEGDVDFLWGTGPAYFERCTARVLTTGTYYTQVRNPPGARGFVFVECRFDGAPGVTDVVLSRIQPWRFPESEVVLLDCAIGPAVSAAGWQFQAGPQGTGDTSQLRFWEYGSRGLDGARLDLSGRLPGTRRLTDPADRALIEKYRNPTFVLGGWNPLQRLP